MRFGKLQNRRRAARPQDAMDFRQPRRVIGEIAKAKGRRQQIEAFARERQGQRVRLHENRLRTARHLSRFVPRPNHHGMDKIGANNLRPVRARFLREYQRQIARAAAQVQNARIGPREGRRESAGPRAVATPHPSAAREDD